MSLNLPDIVNFTCLFLMFAALLMATVTDIKRGEIPLLFVLLLGSICIILQLIAGSFYVENIFYGMFVFGLYFVMAYFFQGGGGDAILMSILAFVIRGEILNIMLLAHLVFFVPSFYIKIKRKEKALPFAPYVFAAYIIHYCFIFLVSC